MFKKLAQIETSKIVTIVGICLMSCIILYSGITSAFNFDEQNWTIDNDTGLVWFEDDRAFLSAYPHNISSSQWVYFNLTSYNQSGNIDAVWGFKGDSVKPKRAELYKHHYVNWTTFHSQFFQDISLSNNVTDTDTLCDYGNDYNPKHFNITYQICNEWNELEMRGCIDYNTTSSVVCFDSKDATFSPNITFLWHTKHSRLEKWKDISNKFTSKDWNYENMTKWWLLKNITIQKDKNYQVRAWMDVPIGLSQINGKYFWAIKPTNMNLTTAKDKGCFYALDPWFNSSWTYKKNITIDYTKVNGSQVNFPVLINITDTDLRDNAQANGDDIAFTNSTGSQLDHEIEFYNSTTGWLVAWVRVPTLSNTTNTTLSMYYGNADASNQQNVSGVWDSNFVMVQHLSETPSGASNVTYDSTSNGNNGTATNMYSNDQVAGQIDGSLDFDGAGDYVEVASLSAPTNKTFSLWIYARSHSGSYNTLLEFATDDPWFGLSNTGQVWLYTAAKTDDTITQNVWSHIVYTSDGSAGKIYIDGSFSKSGNADTQTGSELGIGYKEGDSHFNGLIDEVRISNTARSAGWIATEYNNQYSPDSFYSVGGEETEGVGDETYPIFSNYWDNNGTLLDSGTGLFNVTIISTNGTVLLEIDGNNITATNLTSNVYNVSYVFSSGGTYPYKWHSWGNGTNANYNVSISRNYVVNDSAVDCWTETSGKLIIPPGCKYYTNVMEFMQ